jgi:hypothetical protein
MTKTGWVLGTLAVAGIVFTIKGGCLNSASKAPDEKLAARLDDLCEIARANISTPERGVRKLGGYMGKHTGDIFGDWGNTLAAIEKITDDDKHDDRARVARDRIRKPLITCARDWGRFFEAVEDSPEASELMADFNERLNRTFEIIFGEGLTIETIDLKRLPTMLALPAKK